MFIQPKNYEPHQVLPIAIGKKTAYLFKKGSDFYVTLCLMWFNFQLVKVK